MIVKSPPLISSFKGSPPVAIKTYFEVTSVLSFKIIELDFYSKPLLYIHIPKTGGSYVEDIFKMNGYLVGKFNEVTLLGTPRNIIKKGYKCNKWHTPFKYNVLVFNNSTC